MAIYNTSNLTANNIADALNRATELEPSIGMMLLVVGGMIMFVALLAKNSLAKAATAASFMAVLISLFLQPLGIVSNSVVVIAVLVASIGAAYAVYRLST